jgi:REP element-mobilizing transposase RayT
MTTAHSLSHTKWDCKYHIVWNRNIVRRSCFESCGKSSGQCCENWPGTEKPRWWKGDCVQTMCTY